ncbi:hypothetical protein MB14_08260 [Roseivirga ehrenbergii]|uniref:Uncharacterized protein n=1 Tax=Roseivirga ehrenbergii (strain DSM 102268 / JCM 13514 / KCTC 12282 / NCIMB 14502 / KMM 6017) TaxID=279360 RepID=A0A150WZX6_ROSEK|nr:hypothetical protein MB14_08260 [Roseivirga ehrenbergii]
MTVRTVIANACALASALAQEVDLSIDKVTTAAICLFQPRDCRVLYLPLVEKALAVTVTDRHCEEQAMREQWFVTKQSHCI